MAKADDPKQLRSAPVTRVAAEEEEQAAMSFGDHLEALRRSLIWSILGVGAIMCLTCYYGRSMVLWLCQPLIEAQRQLNLPQQTINLSVAGGFMVYLKVSVIAALALGAPWIVYQLWRFVKPGLYRNERRFAGLIAPFSAAMSAVAVLFLYYLFLPAAVSFLLMFSTTYPPASGDSSTSLRAVTRFFNQMNSYVMPGWGKQAQPVAPPTTQSAGSPLTRVPIVERDPEHPADGELWFNKPQAELRISLGGQTQVIPRTPRSLMIPQIDINEYLNFVVVLGLILVISFQLPVVMTLLASVGLVSPRTLARYRLYVAFGCFIVGVFITPNQDIVSNIVFPLLLWALFELGLLVMRLVWKEPKVAVIEDAEESGPMAS